MKQWTAKAQHMKMDSLLVDCAKSAYRAPAKCDGTVPTLLGHY